MMKDNKDLVEKKPSLIQKILEFLFGKTSNNYEEIVETEEVENVEEVIEDEEFDEDFEEIDDISDYSEEDIIKLQEDYEAQKIDIDSLTPTQTNLLFTLYMDQVKEISKSNEEKKKLLVSNN